MTIGERVAWYRQTRGLTQEVCAGLVGRTTDWLSKVENSHANLDRLSVLKSLADVLQVTVGDLVETYEPPAALGRPATAGFRGSPATAPADNDSDSDDIGLAALTERDRVAAELQAVRDLLDDGDATTARARLDDLATRIRTATDEDTSDQDARDEHHLTSSAHERQEDSAHDTDEVADPTAADLAQLDDLSAEDLDDIAAELDETDDVDGWDL